MSDVKLKIEKIKEDAKLPDKAHTTDSGFDVFAHEFIGIYTHGGGNGERYFTGEDLKRKVIDKEITLSYLERVFIGTGLKATVGPGYEIQVRSRSGLALKQGLMVLNSPGTIDADYRGQVSIIIINLSREEKKIKIGDKIAQLVIQKVELPEIQVVEKLEEPITTRNEGGFGSTDTTKVLS